jgi:hypothetical protein
VIAVGTMYIIACLIVSGMLINLGRSHQQAAAVASERRPQNRPNDSLWPNDPLWPSDSILNEATADPAILPPVADVRTAMGLGPLLESQLVRVEVDAPSGLLVPMRAAELADRIQELLTTVIQSVPASHLLFTATQKDNAINITITDDIPRANIEVRKDQVRGLIQRISIDGATIDVKVHPTEGTTLTLRLPSMLKDRRARAREEATAPFADHPMVTRLSSDKSR